MSPLLRTWHIYANCLDTRLNALKHVAWPAVLSTSRLRETRACSSAAASCFRYSAVIQFRRQTHPVMFRAAQRAPRLLRLACGAQNASSTTRPRPTPGNDPRMGGAQPSGQQQTDSNMKVRSATPASTFRHMLHCACLPPYLQLAPAQPAPICAQSIA